MKKLIAGLLALCLLPGFAGAEELNIPVTPVLELSEFGIPILPVLPETEEGPQEPAEEDVPAPPVMEEPGFDEGSDPEANLPALDEETFPFFPEDFLPVPEEPQVPPLLEEEEEALSPRPDGDAYIVLDGVRRYDDIEDLIPYGLQGYTIYLFHMDLIDIETDKVEDYTFSLLEKITFDLCPDEGTGFTRSTVVHVSKTGSYGQDEPGRDYLWAGRPRDELFEVAQLPGEESAVTEWELQVQKDHYVSDGPCEPVFTLVPSPDLTDGMSLAVSINGGTPEALSSSVYMPSYSGSYRFAIWDEDENVAAWSAAIPVEVTAYIPEWSIEVEEELPEEPVPEEEEFLLDLSVEEDEALPAAEPSPSPAPIEEPVAKSAELEDVDSGMMVLPAEEETILPPEEEEQESQPAPTSGQAYYLDSDSQPVYGDLEALLSSEADPIYISTTGIIVLDASFASALSGKTLLPASSGYNIVNISVTSPDLQVESASSLFVWQDVQNNASQEEAAISLSVSASQLKDAQWSSQSPSFTLSISSDADLINTYAYGVSIDGGSLLQLTEAYSASGGASSAHFTATAEGKHTYQFHVMRHDGEIAASSDVYSVWLDRTAPVLTLTTTREYGMRVIAGDAQSGFGALSLSGKGIAADQMENAGGGVWTYTHTAEKQITYPAGSIILTDAAGNQTSNEAEFTLYASLKNMMSALGMGGSRGYGSSGRTVYHSESDVESVIAYNAVDLVVSPDSMTQLEIGDEVLDLALSRNSFAVGEQADPTFTAHFTSWNGDAPDTLVLTVNEDSALADGEGYTWSFSGAVYKKLAASGIDYMMLRVGDEITALSTAGFTAGIRYSMYRAEGLPSKAFRYDVRMGMESLPFEMDVTVNGATYAMSDDTEAEMYYYDVYSGRADEFRALEK